MLDIPADWDFHSILNRRHFPYVAFELFRQKWKVAWIEKPQTFAIETEKKFQGNISPETEIEQYCEKAHE